MVLLRHDLPDGSSHYDWLIGRGGPGMLLSFRVARRIDSARCRAFRAQRIADHRRLYLAYEGEVSGGRGRVRLVAAGPGRVEVETAERVVVVGSFGQRVGRCRFEGRPAADGLWAFRKRPAD